VVGKAKARFPEIAVREWNLADHPELGPRYGVMATPAIVINGRLEFGGVPREQAFHERLALIAARTGA
jgi:protein-disulfide isomerase